MLPLGTKWWTNNWNRNSAQPMRQGNMHLKKPKVFPFMSVGWGEGEGGRVRFV